MCAVQLSSDDWRHALCRCAHDAAEHAAILGDAARGECLRECVQDRICMPDKTAEAESMMHVSQLHAHKAAVGAGGGNCK